MKKVLSLAALTVSALLMPRSAGAQMAVIDGANLAQTTQTALQAVAQVAKLEAQLQQLQQTYSMFTTPTNVTGMVSGLESQAIENPLPLANSLSSLIGGQTSGGIAATTYYNQNHIYAPTDGSQQSAQLNKNGQSIANMMGIATTNLASIEQRLQELPNLQADLNAATSITQVEAINGRLASEAQFVQAQQVQASNLAVLASEQQASTQQQQAEAHLESDDNFSTALQQSIAVGN